MKENLFRKIERGQDFKVPEGYFDQLTSEIIEKVSEHQTIRPSDIKKKPANWIKHTLYAAAFITGIVFTISVTRQEKKDPVNLALSEESIIDLTSDEFIDETMLAYSIDDYSFYLYLSGDDN